MAQKSLFDQLYRELQSSGFRPRSFAATAWFRDRVKELTGKINRQKLLNDPELNQRNKAVIGRMFMFVYDPKHKDTLPYYDRFPLIIMVGKPQGQPGFYGINLHYLDPLTRAAFLDELIAAFGTEKGTKPSIRARFGGISYQKLKNLSKLKEFAPCFKHYLPEHVRSKFAEVQAPDWQTAIWLPTQHFAKKNARTVWAESRKSI